MRLLKLPGSSTYRVTQQTRNWTMLPENWLALREQWEYSHAAGAGLNVLVGGGCHPAMDDAFYPYTVEVKVNATVHLEDGSERLLARLARTRDSPCS